MTSPTGRARIGNAGPLIAIQRLPIRVGRAANLRETIIEERRRPMDTCPNAGT